MARITSSNSLVNPKKPFVSRKPKSYTDVCEGIVELLNVARQAAARNVNAQIGADALV
jgi:hypothetical protein